MSYLFSSYLTEKVSFIRYKLLIGCEMMIIKVGDVHCTNGYVCDGKNFLIFYGLPFLFVVKHRSAERTLDSWKPRPAHD